MMAVSKISHVMSMDNSAEAVALFSSIKRLLTAILLVLLSIVMYFGKDIVMPIALGILISLTMTPPVRALTSRFVPASLAAFLVIFSVASVIGAGGYFLSEPIAELIESVPEMRKRAESKLIRYQSSIEAISEVNEQVADLTESARDDSVKVVVKQPGLITSAASSIGSGLTSIALALVLALFLLSSGTLFYEKLIGVIPQLSGKKRALRIVKDVESNVSRYLFTISLINAGLGLLVGTLLHLYGVQSAALWGVIAAVFNFLPFIGAIAGSLLLAAVSLGFYDSIVASLVPAAIYMGCSVIEGNIITPLIVGRRLKLNVVAVFLAVTIWAWLWGISGALMAVPLLVVVKVLCDHVENWHTLGAFLSARREPSALDMKAPGVN